MTSTLTRAALACALITGPAALAADTTPASQLDLERYLGKWYETARFDNFFERGLSDVYATYERQEDGSIRVTNSGKREDGTRKTATGKATKEPGSPAGELQVSFIPPHALFSTAYRILYVTPDYEGALVSDNDGSNLWLLQRSESGNTDVEEDLLEEAVRRGFDVRKLIFDGGMGSNAAAHKAASEAEVDAD